MRFRLGIYVTNVDDLSCGIIVKFYEEYNEKIYKYASCLKKQGKLILVFN